MNKAFAQQILQDIQTVSLRRMQSTDIHLLPFSPAYTPVSFCEEYFQPLSSSSLISSPSFPSSSDKVMYFVDGGNAEILQTPDYCLQFLRFACVGFQNGKRVFQKKREGYVLAASLHQENEIVVTLKGYGDLADVSFPSFSLDDPLLGDLSLRTKLNRAIEVFRALHEIQFASELSSSIFSSDSLLVFDRALLPENSHEQRAFASLYEAASEKSIIVSGLNKTTALLCNTGESVVSHLASFDKRGSWLYSPVFSTHDLKHNAVLSFVRLHARSQHIFRLEVCASFADKLFDVASLLASQSIDGVFLGYPYGLLVADQLARVSNREKEALQTLFFAHTGEERFSVAALNAHGILDGKI
ncbi:hypothetical protein HZC31_00260 [Candidatus Woesearchaeota archaeon]|nr:hypothetical protein [Candidatus Woesearchaeota archaeon]